jgi:hypothetical protein
MSLTDEDKNWITEQLRTVETSLLTEFHKWASPSEARQRTHTATLRAIDLEMESLSERVSKLEGQITATWPTGTSHRIAPPSMLKY